jgi:hypothetical protein
MRGLSGWTLVLLLAACPARAEVAFDGIHIGDDARKLDALPLKLTNKGADETLQWRMYDDTDGNSLWFSVKDGKVIRIDETWKRKPGSMSSFPARDSLQKAGFKYVYRSYYPFPLDDDMPDLFDCFVDSHDPDRLVVLKGRTPQFEYHPGMSLEKLPYKLEAVAISTRAGLLSWNPVAEACEPDKVLWPPKPLTLSTQATDTPAFSMQLPEGFTFVDLEKRLPTAGVKNIGPGYADYLYSPDPAPKAWLPFVQISFAWRPAPGQNIQAQSLMAPAFMYAGSHVVKKDPQMEKRSISGVDLQCTEWSDETEEPAQGGYFCMTDMTAKGDAPVIVIFIQDYTERYKARKDVYMAMLQSLKFKPGAPKP